MSDDTVRAALAVVDATRGPAVSGRVTELTGLVLRATLPDARAGELVTIECAGGELPAKVVGFRGEQVVLMPLGPTAGVGPGCRVRASGQPLMMRAGRGLLGRVLDGLGRPIDGRGPLEDVEPWAVDRPAPPPLSRQRVTRALTTGVRAIDAAMTLGEGQRVGLFASAGVGKSTLLGQIARQADADVSVIALVGERGREVREFVEGALGAGLSRSVVVCATSDAPALVRLEAAAVATAAAEWFREHGARVLLLMDSVTRVARAQREVGLAAGEPPARQGYPPSVFALLPRLLERTGAGVRGTITALYTVLVAGGDLDEPIADEVRGILDGHIVLSRSLAERNHWPAIDVLASLSRVMHEVAAPEHRDAAGRLRELLAAYEARRDLIVLGAYQAGSDPRTDAAIAAIDAIEDFLRQPSDHAEALEDTLAALSALA